MHPETKLLDLAAKTLADTTPHEVFMTLLDDADLPASEVTPAARKLVAQITSHGVREIFSFCFGDYIMDEDGARTVIRRFFAVAWLLHSEMLLTPNKRTDGRNVPATLDFLGKLPQLNCTRCNLSVLAQKFGGLFAGFRTRVQKRDTSKPNYAKSAALGWRRLQPRLRLREPSASRP